MTVAGGISEIVFPILSRNVDASLPFQRFDSTFVKILLLCKSHRSCTYNPTFAPPVSVTYHDCYDCYPHNATTPALRLLRRVHVSNHSHSSDALRPGPPGTLTPRLDLDTSHNHFSTSTSPPTASLPSPVSVSHYTTTRIRSPNTPCPPNHLVPTSLPHPTHPALPLITPHPTHADPAHDDDAPAGQDGVWEHVSAESEEEEEEARVLGQAQGREVGQGDVGQEEDEGEEVFESLGMVRVVTVARVLGARRLSEEDWRLITRAQRGR